MQAAAGLCVPGLSSQRQGTSLPFRPVLWGILEPSQVIYTHHHQQTGHLQGPFYGWGNIKMIDLSGVFSKVILKQKLFKSMT